jgi:hypothetical protein
MSPRTGDGLQPAHRQSVSLVRRENDVYIDLKRGVIEPPQVGFMRLPTRLIDPVGKNRLNTITGGSTAPCATMFHLFINQLQYVFIIVPILTPNTNRNY